MSSWDPVWEKIYQSTDWGQYPSENLIQFIARNFYNRNRQEVKILEVGCGTGANIWFLSREGFRVYGVDGSSTAIEKAAKRLQREGLTADLQKGDIVKLDYESGTFDAVLDVECLCTNSTENTRAILKEMNRVLKNEGLLYSRTFSDKMFLGKDYTSLGNNEYTNIQEGPLAGKGFVRLTGQEGAAALYGEQFEIMSVDKLEYTQYNLQMQICELIVIAKKT